jgi:hypothetical protein
MFIEVIDKESGKEFRLYWTDALRLELAQHDEEECTHTKAEIRWFRASNGAIHYKRQCQTCGELIGQAIGKINVPADCGPRDESLYEHYRENRQARRDEILQRHVLKQKSEDSEFWVKYNAYLKTQEWRALANRVLKRAGGICEGCGQTHATQVHHRTYEHVFEEFLFELVAVCDGCHNRLHPDRSAIPEEWQDNFPCQACRFQSENDGRRWCSQFDSLAVTALSEQGECGPARAGFEALK